MARPKIGEEKRATRQVAFRIPEWVRAGFDRISAERKVPLSDLANDAFVAYLKRQGIKPEKAQEAKKAGGRRPISTDRA